MKKIRRIFTLIISIIFITSCANTGNKFEINDEVTLEGKITTSEIIKDGKKEKINLLELEKPIIINNKKVYKIEIDFDKELKETDKVTITGTIKSGSELSVLNLDYIFDATDIDNVLSYVNTFSNKDFSMTIPTSIIKITTVEELENGFIVYSTSNMESGGEVFRVLSVTSKEFKELRDNKEKSIEKITSDNDKTIVIIYPTTTEYDEENQKEYETIGNEIARIKNNIKIK